MRDGRAIIIEIEGKPVPWARAGTQGKHRFTPAKVKNWKDLAALKGTLAMAGTRPLSGPLRLTYTAVCEIPQSWPKWKKQAALDGFVAMTAKPDLDNLVKCVKDAFNKVVYTDDSQIVATNAQKKYGPAPMVIAKITPLTHCSTTATRDEYRAFQFRVAG